MSAVVQQVLIQIGAQTVQAIGNFNRVAEALTGIGGAAEKAAVRSASLFEGLGKAASAAVPQLAAMQLGMAGIAAFSLKAAAGLNAEMANVATLIPDQTSRVLELKDAVIELSKAHGRETTDLAAGLYQTISAFGDEAASTVKKLEINSKAAAAGLATTTEALSLTSSVTKGYGDTSAEAVQHASDLAFQAVKLGQTTFPELAGSVGRVVPLMASLGGSQEELFAVMATFTGVTGAAAEVSTQLRGALQSLLAPTEDGAKLIEALGFKSGEAMVKELGVADAIAVLTEAAQKSGKPLQDFIGSIEGQTLALALVGGQADTYRGKLAAMKDVAGETDKAFRNQRESTNALGVTWNDMAKRAAEIAQRLGDGLAPAAMDVLKALEPMVVAAAGVARGFSAMAPELQKAVVVTTVLGPALLGLVLTLSKLALAAAAIKFILPVGTFTALGAAASAAVAPVSALIASINVAAASVLPALAPAAAGAIAAFIAWPVILGAAAIALGVIIQKAHEANQAWDEANGRMATTFTDLGHAVSEGTRIWAAYKQGVKLTAEEAKRGAAGLRLLAAQGASPEVRKRLQDNAKALLDVAAAASKVGKVAKTKAGDLLAGVDFSKLFKAPGTVTVAQSASDQIEDVLAGIPKSLQAIDQMKLAFGDTFNQSEAQAGMLRGALTRLYDLGLKKGDKRIASWEKAWEQAVERLKDGKKAAFDVTRVWNDYAQKMAQATITTEIFGERQRGLEMAVDAAREQVLALAGNVDAAGDQFHDATKVWQDAKAALDKFTVSGDITKALKTYADDITGIGAAALMMGDRTGGAKDMLERTKKAIEDLAPILAELTAKFGESDPVVLALKAQVEALGGKLVELKDKAKGDPFEQLREASVKVFGAVGDLAGGLLDLVGKLGIESPAIAAASWLAGIGTAAASVVEGVGKLAGEWPKFAGAIMTTLKPALDSAGDALLKAFGPQALAVVGNIIGGLGGAIPVVAGALTGLILAAVVATNWERIKKTVGRFFADLLSPGSGTLLDRLDDISARAMVLGGTFNAASARAEALSDRLVDLYRAQADGNVVTQALNDTWAEWQRLQPEIQMEKVRDASRDYNKALVEMGYRSRILGETVQEDATKLEALRKWILEAAAAGYESTGTFQNMVKQFKELQDVVKLESVKDDLQAAGREAQFLNNEVRDFSDKVSMSVVKFEVLKNALIDMARAGEQNTTAYGELLDQFRELKPFVEAIERVKAIGDSLRSGIQSGFQGAVRDFLTGTKSLASSLYEGIREAIINAIVDATVQSAVVKGAFGSLLSQFSEVLAGGGDASGIIAKMAAAIPQLATQLEAALTPLRKALTNSLPGLNDMVVSGGGNASTTLGNLGASIGLAAGGIARGATRAVVGEGNFAEAVLPLSRQVFDMLGAGIVQAPAFAAAGGGGGTTINLYISGNRVSSDRDADELGERIVRRLRQAGVAL